MHAHRFIFMARLWEDTHRVFTAAVHRHLDHRPLVQPGESIHSEDKVHARVPTPTHCCSVYLGFTQLHKSLSSGGRLLGTVSVYTFLKLLSSSYYENVLFYN